MKKVVIAVACAAVLFGAGDDAKKPQDAWDSGDTRSCYNLGGSYYNDQGVKQDLSKASELYAKACDMGYANGCYNLGVLYAEGQGVNKDKQAAKKYFGKACDMGLKQGCDNHKILSK